MKWYLNYSIFQWTNNCYRFRTIRTSLIQNLSKIRTRLLFSLTLISIFWSFQPLRQSYCVYFSTSCTELPKIRSINIFQPSIFLKPWLSFLYLIKTYHTLSMSALVIWICHFLSNSSIRYRYCSLSLSCFAFLHSLLIFIFLQWNT